jgi:hypothetical protein
MSFSSLGQRAAFAIAAAIFDRRLTDRNRQALVIELQAHLAIC